MNRGDEQTIRQRLHTEIGSVEISPAPVISITRRGRAIRARRRALAGATAALVVAAVLAARVIAAPGPVPNRVTLNAPDPSAPGGVFASGTADGKPWRLAVRNIAADPGTLWCLPAVMLNGRNGNVLFGTARGDPSLGNLVAFLRDIPGLPGVGAMVAQVTPGVTRLVATLPDGRKLTVRPVPVSACGQSFYLAGFLFADPRHGVSELATYSRLGFVERLSLTDAATGRSLFGTTPPGVWANLDTSRADIAASQADQLIGTGTVAGRTWHIRTGLGLFGQCYTATVRGGGHSYQCVPVAAPPPTLAFSYVPVPGPRWQLAGYAGLVSPRTASVVADFSSGPPHTFAPVNVAGRMYVAIVAPPDVVVDAVFLYDSAGHQFASAETPMPGSGSTATLPAGK